MKSDSRKVTLASEIRKGQLSVAVSIVFTFGICFFINNYYLSKNNNTKLIESTAAILTQNLAAPLLFRDPKEITRTLQSLVKHPILESAIVLDEKQHFVSAFPTDESPKPEQLNKTHYQFVIENQGEKIGTLYLYTRSDFEFYSVLSYGLVGLVVILVGFLVAQISTRIRSQKIVFQLLNILKVIRSITKDEKYSMRILTENADTITLAELYDLARDFDVMLNAIEDRDRKITQIHQNLEKIVEERTFQLKEAQASLIQGTKMAALGEMSAGIAHEINNPLAIIAGAIAVIPKVINDSEKLNSKISSIDRATQRITKIVLGLKKFSRVSESKERHLHSLKAIILEAIVLTEAKSKQQATPVSVDLRTDGIISCDEIEIEQILINLINNGIDAIESLEDRWLKISLFEEGHTIILQIRDSGKGIPPEVKAKLFQPFFTTKPVGKGTGLGLSIVRGIVADHQATIDILSQDPNTCFEVRFPKPNTEASAQHA